MRIIVFDIDSLRPDHLGCYGYHRPTSPNIDRLAGEGVCFDRYYCPDSPCMPSRMSWISGRFGIHNGCVSNVGIGSEFDIRKLPYGGPIPEQETMMRQLRRHTGLEAIGISNFADRHCAQWFTHGWTEFISPSNKCGAETGEEVNETVLDWLDKNRDRDDFLLYVNYWDVHRPYKMDGSWADRFVDLPIQDWPDEATLDRMSRYSGPFTARHQFKDCQSKFDLMPGQVTTREEFEHMVNGYDASIAYTDHQLGIVLNKLEELAMLEDAIIVITGDHGDAFGEHGIYSDHVCADECVHRIPLIIRWPGMGKPGVRDGELRYGVDFAPTLCEMLGAPIPEHWDGASFAPALRGADSTPGREYLVWGHALYTTQRAVRTNKHLFTRTYDPHLYHQYQQFAPIELYDMENDPFQTHNLVDERPDLVADMDEKLDGWLIEQLSKPGAGPDPFIRVIDEQMRQGYSSRLRRS